MFSTVLTRLYRRVFCFLLLIDSTTVAAESQSKETLVQLAVHDLRLQDSPTWRRLLHFRPGETQSEILSPDFFIAPQGARSPEAELIATLTAFNQPAGQTACRFPARFIWLNQYFEFEQDLRECTRLNAWAKTADLRSVSLILVSGYFGNPASTFGHALLKINNSSHNSRLGLLDMGINFGALVPDNELAPVYIVKGLLGGYQAGFSDRDYYAQDQVYARTELRDMWEYELQLTEFQKQLVVFHLFEIAGKKFRYYFLSENCAFRLAELIELALERDLTTDTRVWYAPVELFQRLKAIEQQEQRSILAEGKYIASNERLMYQAFLELSPPSLQAAKQFITTEGPTTSFDHLGESERISLLNALISFYQFKAINAGEGKDAHFQQLRNQLLSERLKHPARRQESSLLPRRSPADASRPSRLGLGVSHGTAVGVSTRLDLSAFHYDEIGDNTLEGSSLVVADAQLVLSEDDKLYLRRLDLVRASKNTLRPIDLPGENLLSWDLALGLKQQRLGCQNCSTGYGHYGIGGSFASGGMGLVHVKLFAEYQSRDDGVFLRPSLGYILNSAAGWAAQLNLSKDFDLHHGQHFLRASLHTRHSLGEHWEVRAAIELESAAGFDREITLGLARRF